MAITPQPGYMVDPTNPNGVVKSGSTPMTPPAAQTTTSQVNPNASFMEVHAPTQVQPPVQNTQPPVTPQTTPPPTVNVNVGQPQTNTQTPAAPATSTPVPTSNLQQGAQGQDVSNLQNYLVQQGYLTPDQVATGPGVYGPQTTAAVAKLQKDLGIQAGSAAGMYGPQTQSAIQKYQQAHQQLSQSGQNVDQAGTARQQVQDTLQTSAQKSSDPVFGAMASSLEPIMQSLTQVLQNINNPALSAVSLQTEYNDMAKQYNLPAMQTKLLNMTNIMNGTEQDIRDEVTKAGGFATESQVMGMAATRNKVIMKDYNSLSTQYQAAQTNVDNMMKYATSDQQTQLQRQQMTATITGSMASIEAQMMQMGMTMQNNARQSVQYNVTQMGYKGLAASTGGNPDLANYYEKMLALAPGTLSNPAAVAQMDTYKDQQLQLNNYKAAIAAFNAGYGGGGGGGGTPGGGTPSGQVGATPVDPTTLVRPSWVDPKVPLTLSAAQMEQYMGANTAAKTDPGTNNIVAPGIGYYVHQSDGSYTLNSALPSPVEQQYKSIKQTMDSAGIFKGSPTITRKWTLSANSAISSFKDTGTYKIASNVAPYLAAIHAAAANPGDKSISDFELLDSFVKAAKGGTGQVTDSQINVMLHGASVGDKYDIIKQKLSQGGMLAPAQRTALVSLADETYKRNLEDYQKGYVQAVQAMQGQGIPPQFWRNLPDFTSLEPVQ